MDIMNADWRLDHIAHAVFDIDQTLSHYRLLTGFAEGPKEQLPEHGVEVCFIHCGNTNLELISPLDEASSLRRFLDKRGEGLHHLCFAVSNLAEELKRLADSGVALIDSSPRLGAGNTQVAFLHPKSFSGVLVELCQGGHKAIF